MGLFSWLSKVTSSPPGPAATFSVSGPKPIDQLFAEMRSGSSMAVSRAEALSVPAVTKGRNLLCSVATLPLEQLDTNNNKVRNPLLEQFDPDLTNVVHLAQTIEDLVFDAISWWRITEFGFDGYPTKARHLTAGSVSLDPPISRGLSPLPSGADPRGMPGVWVDGVFVSATEIIRFDSPNPGVLSTCARSIRRAVRFDQAAERYARNPRPLDYFTPTDGVDPAKDEEIQEILSDWQQARRTDSTAYVPAALSYNSVTSPTPADLQLVQLQQQVGLDLANALGVDPEDLGISTTSRSYANIIDRRRDRINDVLAPYMLAISQRLSMGDITKPGYRVEFDLDDYLKSNPTERWATYTAGKNLGVYTEEEIRQMEGLPARQVGQTDSASQSTNAPSDPALDKAQQLSTIAQKSYLAVGKSITTEENRQLLRSAGWDELAVELPDELRPGPTNTPTAQEAAMSAGTPNTEAPAAMQFDADQYEHTFSFTVDDDVEYTFAADSQRRTVSGVALPYNQVTTKYGMGFRFKPGSIQYSDVSRVKHYKDHYTPVGKALSLKDTKKALMATLSVARGAAGDELLQLAEDGVYDGLSVGVDFSLDPEVGDVVLARDGVYDVLRASLREISSTPMPSFDDARMTKVVASRNPGGNVTDTAKDGQTPAAAEPAVTPTPQPASVKFSDEQLAQLRTALTAPEPAPAAAPAQAPAAGEFSAEQVASLRTALGLPEPAPAATPEPRPVVDPTRLTASTSVKEALPYRFDRGGNFQATEHVFSTDLRDMQRAGDLNGATTDAGKRVMALIAATFDTDSADVNELNPTINRPDMYVDQRDFMYPLWDAINKGAPPNGVQPFAFPKFNTASGLVGDHTEGTEPAAGSFTTTGQTVTPTAISGKASLTREVYDMGGNPAVSTLIYNQMVRGYREGLESATATFLNTLTAATDINLGVAVVDDALADAWDQALAGLAFVRGYDFSVLAVEQVLYKAFVGAEDTAGRRLYPILNPQNATGTSAARFRQLDLSGVVGTPSWALASTPGAPNNSWLFDPSTVYGWATAPQRLEFAGTTTAGAYGPVAMIDIALFGYKAFANTDIGGVRQVIYDSAP